MRSFGTSDGDPRLWPGVALFAWGFALFSYGVQILLFGAISLALFWSEAFALHPDSSAEFSSPWLAADRPRDFEDFPQGSFGYPELRALYDFSIGRSEYSGYIFVPGYPWQTFPEPTMPLPRVTSTISQPDAEYVTVAITRGGTSWPQPIEGAICHNIETREYSCSGGSYDHPCRQVRTVSLDPDVQFWQSYEGFELRVTIHNNVWPFAHVMVTGYSVTATHVGTRPVFECAGAQYVTSPAVIISHDEYYQEQGYPTGFKACVGWYNGYDPFRLGGDTAHLEYYAGCRRQIFFGGFYSAKYLRTIAVTALVATPDVLGPRIEHPGRPVTLCAAATARGGRAPTDPDKEYRIYPNGLTTDPFPCILDAHCPGLEYANGPPGPGTCEYEHDPDSEWGKNREDWWDDYYESRKEYPGFFSLHEYAGTGAWVGGPARPGGRDRPVAGFPSTDFGFRGALYNMRDPIGVSWYTQRVDGGLRRADYRTYYMDAGYLTGPCSCSNLVFYSSGTFAWTQRPSASCWWHQINPRRDDLPLRRLEIAGPYQSMDPQLARFSGGLTCDSRFTQPDYQYPWAEFTRFDPGVGVVSVTLGNYHIGGGRIVPVWKPLPYHDCRPDPEPPTWDEWCQNPPPVTEGLIIKPPVTRVIKSVSVTANNSFRVIEGVNVDVGVEE